MRKVAQHLANCTITITQDINIPAPRPCSVTVSHGAAGKGHGAPGFTRRREKAELGRQKGMPGPGPSPDLSWTRATPAGCYPELAASSSGQESVAQSVGLHAR